MSPEWNVFPDAQAAAVACGQRILNLLEEAVPSSKNAALAVSGGSTPKLMFDSMASAKFDWSPIHLFWSDERSVPPTDPESNYRLTDEHLIKPARIPANNVHRIQGELPPEQAAKMSAADIREFFGVPDGEFPHFDVLHLGVGPDGHIASLFPGKPHIDNRQDIAAAVYDAPKQPPVRITLLPGVLLAARNIVFLVSGADKAEALEQVINGPYDPHKYPAQVVARSGRKVVWFVDAAAGSRIRT